ncbi:hypothetical protein P9112_005561 [Eukaryota sp. TZLM1-RC]
MPELHQQVLNRLRFSYIGLALACVAQYLLAIYITNDLHYDIVSISLIPLAALFNTLMMAFIHLRLPVQWLRLTYFLYLFLVVTELGILIYATIRYFTVSTFYVTLSAFIFFSILFYTVYTLLWSPLLNSIFEKLYTGKQQLASLLIDDDQVTSWTFLTGSAKRKEKESSIILLSMMLPYVFIGGLIFSVSSQFSINQHVTLSLLIGLGLGSIIVYKGDLIPCALGAFLLDIHEKKNIFKTNLPRFVKQIIYKDYLFRFPFFSILLIVIQTSVIIKLAKIFSSNNTALLLIQSYAEQFLIVDDVKEFVNIFASSVLAGVLIFTIVMACRSDQLTRIVKILTVSVVVMISFLIGFHIFELSVLMSCAYLLTMPYEFGSIVALVVEVFVVFIGNLIGILVAMYLLVDRTVDITAEEQQQEEEDDGCEV